VALINREDELKLSISELELKKDDLQMSITEINQRLVILQEINAYNDNLNLEIKQDDLSSIEGNDRNVLDTGKLSEVNLAYNDVTFQLFPGLNVTDKESSEAIS
jgi:hypothetical protein